MRQTTEENKEAHAKPNWPGELRASFSAASQTHPAHRSQVTVGALITLKVSSPFTGPARPSTFQKEAEKLIRVRSDAPPPLPQPHVCYCMAGV